MYEHTNMTDSIVTEKLYISSLNFLSKLTPQETYKKIVDEARKLTGAEHGSVFLRKNKTFKRVYTSIPDKTLVEPRKKGFSYTAYKERRILIVTIEEILKYHPEFEKKSDLKSLILFPLFYNQKSIGVMSLLSKKRNYFDKHKIRTLKLFTSMASLAIHKVQLYSDIQKTVQDRDLFIDSISHELKTPLTVISIYTQMLKSGKSKTSKKEIYEKIFNETKRLSRMVEQIFHTNQIKSNKYVYNWEECSVKEIIRQAEEYFLLNHPKREIVIIDKTKSYCNVVGDFEKLLQVVVNIIDNAAKYSPKNTKIKVNLKNDENFVIIDVKDKGKGIDKNEIPKLFQRFYRGKANKERGLGLGLFLAKRIIEKHNGEIMISSKKKKGTKVEIKLPILRYN